MSNTLANGNLNDEFEIPFPRAETVPLVSDNATSALDSEEEEIVHTLESVPVELSADMYHIVFDCDYGEFVDVQRRQSRSATVFGNIGQKLSAERIPVLYSRVDAINVAKKLITKTVNKGSAGNGRNKKYPFLGAVVIGLRFNTESLRNLTYSKVENYNQIDENKPNNEDLISWDVNGQTRAAVLKRALAYTQIIDAQYIVRSKINVDNGFALLNLVPELSADDVSALKCLYNGQKGECYSENVQSKQHIEEVEVESKDIVQLGGRYGNNYRNLSVREKAMYVVNKNRKMGGGSLMHKKSNFSNGIDMNHASDDSAYWKPLYKKAKQEYKNKKQSGGADQEEYYKQQYIKTKQEYLKLKSQKQNNKMNGGKLNSIDMNHASDDSAYWKPLYLQKKAEYVAKKNTH